MYVKKHRPDRTKLTTDKYKASPVYWTKVLSTGWGQEGRSNMHRMVVNDIQKLRSGYDHNIFQGNYAAQERKSRRMSKNDLSNHCGRPEERM
mgnify:CR=1 FL=1